MPLRTISFIYHHFSFLRCFIWLSFLRVVSFSLISFEEKNVREWEKPEIKFKINFVEIGWIPLMWKGPLIRFFRRCVFLIGVFYFGKKMCGFRIECFYHLDWGKKMLNTLTIWPLSIKINGNCKPFNTFNRPSWSSLSLSLPFQNQMLLWSQHIHAIASVHSYSDEMCDNFPMFIVSAPKKTHHNE